MDPNRFQRIAKALADPRRFEIFEEMAASADELACGRTVERFPVTQATVSLHLKELTDAGLIEIRPEGQLRYCRARVCRRLRMIRPDSSREVSEARVAQLAYCLAPADRRSGARQLRHGRQVCRHSGKC